MDRPTSPSPSELPPVPGSPTYSVASTTANPISAYNLPLPPPPRPAHAVLTKADLEQSQQAYADLLSSAKSYRQALAAISTAASTFGSALEACARLKEARAEAIGPPGGASLSASFTTKGACTADMLLSASGVHQLIANHQQILSETVYRNFEVPLLHELDKWRRDVDDEEDTYLKAVNAQSKEIRRLEKEGLKLHKQRRRDVGKFRAHLVDLTTKLDGLTTLHGDHARSLLRESQETSNKILDASCSLVRAEVDIFESLARKGWSGGGLDDLLEKAVDLFASEDDSNGLGGSGGGDTSKLFSILPPKSILADSASDTARGTNRGDALLMDTERYQSLARVASPDMHARDAGAERIFNPNSNFNKSRGVRPFSPQPIRRHPTDVTFDSLAVGLGSEPSVVKEEDEEAVAEEEQPWRDEGRASDEHASGDSPHEKSADGREREERERGRRWSVTREEEQ